MELAKQEGEFLGMLFGVLAVSIIGNMLTGKGVMKARKGGKAVARVGKRYNTTITWIAPSFISIANLGLMAFFQEIIYLEQFISHKSRWQRM